MTVTTIYRAVMLEFERRRLELGISMEVLDELAGTQDRYWGKALYVDSPSGRQVSWPTLECYAGVLFVDGFDVEIRAKNGPNLSEVKFKQRIRSAAAFSNPKRQRQYLREIGQRGGQKGGVARAARLSPARRRAIARKAGKASAARRRAIKNTFDARNEAKAFDPVSSPGKM